MIGSGGAGIEMPTPPGGLGPWTGHDNVPMSSRPPGGLSPDRVPQLVALTFDDLAYSGIEGSTGMGAIVDGGVRWAATDLISGLANPAGSGQAATYDGTPVRVSLFGSSIYVGIWESESPTFVKRAWHDGWAAGNEMNNHTHNHPHGMMFTVDQWNSEITTCLDWLTKPFNADEVNFDPKPQNGVGIPPDQIHGFRTPYLEWNDAVLSAVAANGFWYDTSIENGWEGDGTNFPWPYTLDSGSPGIVDRPITPHAGLWELPVTPFIMPEELRARAGSACTDPAAGRVTGFDYNLWVSCATNADDFVATLKHTLDLRLQGNRAPFVIGAHPDYYSSKYDAPPKATAPERRAAMAAFVAYALGKPDVRLVTARQILDWVRNPVPLR
ncbi:MAG TPA: hypothetical protein VMU50_07745 [Polyangia bacterium]|nr:hypothetical protein [Polyangia bacterium]